MLRIMSDKYARLTLLAFAFSLAAGQAAAQERIEWQKDFKKASQLAKETGRPILVDFTASWCKPCQEMERVFWPRPEVVELAKKFVCVSLNFDDRGPEVSRYRVDRIPAVIFAGPWGNMLTQKFGFGSDAPATLSRIMQAVPGDFSPVNDYNAVLERDKDNAEALVKVGDFYRKNGIFHLSTDYLRRALKTKELAADRGAREDILIAVAINYLKLQDNGDAKKSFEEYLKEFPAGKHADTALLGILTTQVNRKKLAEAEKTLELLKAGYPGSPLVERAAAMLQGAKSQKN